MDNTNPVDRIYHLNSYGDNMYTTPVTTTTSSSGATHRLQQQRTASDASLPTQHFQTLRVATYNALSLSEGKGLATTGQVAHLGHLMDKQQLDCLLLQETRLNLQEPITM
eukprot:4488546-Amphidinium_carterae.1